MYIYAGVRLFEEERELRLEIVCTILCNSAGKEGSSRELVKTRNEEMGNQKWEMRKRK